MSRCGQGEGGQTASEQELKQLSADCMMYVSYSLVSLSGFRS